MALRNAVQLICYPDRIGSNIRELNQFIDTHVGEAIGGVHLLPPFPSNADDGFAPLTHQEIDPRYGDWSDVEKLAARYDLCIDLVLNHLSDESPQFKDYLQHGKQSKYADLFVDVDAMGPINPDDLAKIHIRKEKEPFREIHFADGSTGRVWCTFTEQQIDLNYAAKQTFDLMEDNIRFLTARGAKLLRLDAFGYAMKRLGTNCFLVEPDIYDTLKWFRDVARRHGAEVLPEVHDHISFQYAISKRQMRPYGFALPVLVLYALLEARSTELKAWLRMCPRAQVTVLDTHDGICIPDAEGTMSEKQIQEIIHAVSEHSADPILRRSAANVHSVGAIYQLTCTFYEALRRNDDAYIAARAIQFFAPGIPQVYYVGLLAGLNDDELVDRTGQARDVNRHFYTLDEAAEAMQAPVVQRLIKLMQFRSRHPAFDGDYQLHYSNDSSVAMGWKTDEAFCEVFVDLHFNTTTITCSDIDTGEPISFRC